MSKRINKPESIRRSAGQRLINVPMQTGFIETMDAALPSLGYSDRSKFIRDACADRLEKGGVKVDRSLTIAPSRMGKGGKAGTSRRKA